MELPKNPHRFWRYQLAIATLCPTQAGMKKAAHELPFAGKK
jgi:hypothetical protein